jgi:RNA polymerase sigma-70 factor (ECF subfamily)
MPLSEDDLLAGARRLEEETLAAIYDAYSPELYYFSYRLLGNVQAAEDLVAATFYRFLRALHTGGGPREHLRAYLYRITHNLAMDHHRRHPVAIDPLEDIEMKLPSGSDPAQQAEDALVQEDVRAALWRLTQEQRQVIVLKFLQGLSNQEVATVLDKPVGAVKSLQHRALEALRRMLLLEPE